MKDSVINDNQLEYRLMGEGDLPIEEIVGALKSINYDGYISYEWIMSWSSDLDDPGIVFPHFMNYITSKYEDNKNTKTLLQ